MNTDDTLNNGTDHTVETETAGRQEITVIHMPQSAAELPAPVNDDIYAQSAALVRDAYDDCVPLVLSVSGEAAPPMHGSVKWSRIRLVLKLREKAEANGYHALAALNDALFERAIVFGFRRTTKVSLRQLQKQGHRLQIERNRAISHQQAAE